MTTSTSTAKRWCRANAAVAAFAMTVVLGACGHNVEVQTAAAPEASSLAGRRTFSVVEASKQSHSNGDGNGSSYGIHDPMVDNSITSNAVRDQIKAAFEARGYRYTPENADFQLSYRATVAPILDTRSYAYGNGYGGYGYYGNFGYYDSWNRPYGGYCCGNDFFGYSEASYDRGTVIVDAIDPGTGTLLWRAQGTSDYYASPKRFMKQLNRAVKAIARKFPAAGTSTPLVAAR